MRYRVNGKVDPFSANHSITCTMGQLHKKVAPVMMKKSLIFKPEAQSSGPEYTILAVTTGIPIIKL